MGLRILVDTNVLIDYLATREPFEQYARKIIELCKTEEVFGAIAAQSIADIFYILRKEMTAERRRAALLNLMEIFYVETIDLQKLKNALLNENFSDFEDCLQTECAISFQADYIVTRDASDYKQSEITAINPEDFCKLFEEDEVEEE